MLMENLTGDFIRMDDFTGQQFLMKGFIYWRQIFQRTVIIPVCGSLSWYRYSLLDPVL